jgi:putative transcriptional regulator
MTRSTITREPTNSRIDHIEFRCYRFSISQADKVQPGHRIVVHLDRLLEDRGMTLTELAERVDVTVVNLSILKNGRARAIRFTTLTALCDVLACQPGDLLSYDGGSYG